jgi:hypothetical protein
MPWCTYICARSARQGEHTFEPIFPKPGADLEADVESREDIAETEGMSPNDTYVSGFKPAPCRGRRAIGTPSGGRFRSRIGPGARVIEDTNRCGPPGSRRFFFLPARSGHAARPGPEGTIAIPRLGQPLARPVEPCRSPVRLAPTPHFRQDRAAILNAFSASRLASGLRFFVCIYDEGR